MSDISTENLDTGQDSPRLARLEILEAVQRVSTLTRKIDATGDNVVTIDSNLSVTGNQLVDGDVAVVGSLKLGGNHTAGQVVVSQGPGQPLAFINQPIGEKGDKGDKGDDGTDGTVWITKTTNPAVGDGVDGNFCLNTVTGDYFSKTSGVWQQLGSLRGPAGASGSAWYHGTGVPSNTAGLDSDYYLEDVAGDYYQKQGGAWSKIGNLKGPKGDAGTGSGSGTSKVFGTVSRYQAVKTTGLGVNIVSSASFKTGISWSRDGTQLLIQDNAHGRSVGERAIVRDANVPYQEGLITSVQTNSYTLDTQDTGASDGTAAAYSMGFTYAHTGAVGSITGGVISAPANWDCVLLAIRIHTAANTRAGNTYQLTVPKGNINGVGPQTTADDVNIPVYSCRQDAITLSSVAATIGIMTTMDSGVFQFAAMSLPAVGNHLICNF